MQKGRWKPPDTVGFRTTVTWSDDRRTVTKSVLDAHRGWRRQFAYELRVNRLLAERPPPVPTPRLLGFDRGRRAMVFEAVDGSPAGPKFPLDLDGATLAGLVDLTSATRRYAERRRWLRRLPLVQRVDQARALGVLSAAEADALRALFRADPPRWVFAHGDVTPRNVIDTGAGLVLIDWEWAGIYPSGYEAAFLWFVVLDVAGAREQVAAAVPPEDEAWFWRSALVVQLLHLPWFRGRPEMRPFAATHERTRDELVERVLS
jgi:hypothetical protein